MTLHDPDLHLFVDDHGLHQVYGVARVLNMPERHPDPVVGPDRPWEKGCLITAWGNVLQEDDGRLRMWYWAFPAATPAGEPEPDVGGFCYAESTDGLNWEKPELGLVEFRGSRANNIFLPRHLELQGRERDGTPIGTLTGCDGLTVLRDEAEPDPARRYKMIGNWQHHGMWDAGVPEKEKAEYWRRIGHYLLSSPDGLRWSKDLVRVKRIEGGDRMLVTRDERNSRFWMTEKVRHLNTPDVGHTRYIGMSLSENLWDWSSPDERVFLLGEEEDYGAGMQHHTFVPFNYGDQDLAYLVSCPMRSPFTETFLAAHRDGASWERVLPNQPALLRGPGGAFDRLRIVPTHNAPVLVGDTLFVYYSGDGNGTRRLGVATLPRDRFVGMGCGTLPRGPRNEQGEGFILTTPVKVGGPELLINLERTSGALRAALRRPDLSEIPGYELTSCRPVERGALRAPLRFEGKSGVRELQGQSVVVEFRLRGAVLYSYRFGEAEEQA